MNIPAEILKKLELIRNLPTLPAVVEKLATTMNDPNSDAQQVANIIEDDPAIMTRILKVVNSAFYASSEEVTSVQHAVARMGMTTVSNLAMTTSVFSAFDAQDDEMFNIEDFWRHSISSGIAAGVVYERAREHIPRRYTKEVLRLAGLLHDIGKIVMIQYLHDDFTKALALAKSSGIPLEQAETQVLNTNHCQIGAWLGAKWNLSNELLQVIEFHHEPESGDEKYSALVSLVHIANYICNQQTIGDSGNSAAPAFLQGAWKQLGLSVSDISDVVDLVNEEAAKSEVLMSFVKE
jgi:putative nucleotidyltransferase with HDIG domain